MRLATGIWRFLVKARDPFGEDARRRDERRLLGTLNAARQREKALEAAAGGEEVTERLANTRAEIAELTARLPRGDTTAFSVFLVVYVLTIFIVSEVYGALREAILEMWGTLDNPFLLEFRYSTSRLAKAGLFLASSVWTGVALAVLLGILWRVQRKLQRRHARALAAAGTGLVLAVAFIFLIAFFSMLIGPLLVPVSS